jgi:heme-degrading monooxygenase HmoA
MVRRTRPVFDQLVASRGAIGFSLRAKVLGKTAWTLSVWENEADLQAFSGGQPHRQVMADLGPSLSGAKFVRWTVPGSALPPHWDEALKRLRSP